MIDFKFLIQTIICVIIVLIGLLFFKYIQPPRVAKVDLVAITTHYTEIMAKNAIGANVNQTQLKEVTDNIKNNLEPVLNTYAKKHNVVILQSQAVVSGDVQDITNYVIDELDKNPR